MSSIPSLSALIKSLTSIDAYRQQPTTPADTVTTAALARGDLSIPVASLTNVANNDPIAIIGSGGTELNEVASSAALAIVPKRKIAIAQDIGARVLEMAKYGLGHIAEDSASIGGSSTSNPINAATSATPIGYFSVGGALSFAFGLLSFDVRSLALFFNMPEIELGTGTSGDPYQIVINQNVVGSQGLQIFRGLGVRTDGKIVEIDMLDCTINVSGEINFSGKQTRPIQVSGNCTAHIARVWS